MTGRNEPCHCGSGLKYKKCHGRNAVKGPKNIVTLNPRPFSWLDYHEKNDRQKRIAMRQVEHRGSNNVAKTAANMINMFGLEGAKDVLETAIKAKDAARQS